MDDRIQLATGPVTWGVDFADSPANPPWQRVLDEIRDSGVGALELGPVGYLPEGAGTISAELSSRRLHAVGSFVFDDLHDPDRRDEVLAATARACRFVAGAGGELLVIIDRPAGQRVLTAGRSDAAPRLSAAAWGQLLDAIREAAELALVSGLRPVFHPHAGSCVEFEDEIERLLEDSEIDICLDLGHAAFAGIDVTPALRRWAGRLGHLHLKDVAPGVLDTVRKRKLDFWEAIGAGVFCPLGEGRVDFAAARAILAEVGYAGPATIEQDRVPGGGEPLEDLRRSLAALEAAGFENGKRRLERTQ
jgi:inosose dehydratase